MYEIELEGQIDAGWLAWFDVSPTAIRIESPGDSGPAVTLLCDVRLDQAGLITLLRQLHGLGVTLLALRLVSHASTSA